MTETKQEQTKVLEWREERKRIGMKREGKEEKYWAVCPMAIVC